ncbi:MAG TPA: succinate dehydrogenase cytochrome b subunit [Myxococcota bacterium]|nr:succinate dehydrogenase cytochrome b subunit [Myxococcota bacterium]
MSWFSNLWATTIGKKIVMAVTGLILVGFVLVHASGNMLVWLGPDAFNHYAAGLKSNPLLLWGVRLTLLAAFPLHIASAIQLVRLNNSARPQGYKKLKSTSSSYAAKTMRYGGILLLAFVVYHVLQYTAHVTNPEFAAYTTAEGTHDAYRMVLVGFSDPAVVVTYLIAVVCLCMHVDHGAWSMLQTFGANHPDYNGLRRQAARAFAVLLFLAFSSVPIGILADLVPAQSSSVAEMVR